MSSADSEIMGKQETGVWMCEAQSIFFQLEHLLKYNNCGSKWQGCSQDLETLSPRTFYANVIFQQQGFHGVSKTYLVTLYLQHLSVMHCEHTDNVPIVLYINSYKQD